MILRRLRVQHFRCFRNPVELSGLGLGVHVVHAPNEMGKSSLVLALARALFDRYSTKDREIQNLRPWGTNLSPTVLVELDAGGKRYRLEKAFLDGAMSTLDEWTGTKFERLADSHDADERVRRFLLSSGAQVGATKLGQWGLARLLWLNQAPERHELPSLDSSLKSRLMDAVGVVALSEAEQRVLKGVEKAYLQYFTSKKGKVAAGSELERSEEAVRSLGAVVEALHAQREVMARHATECEEARVSLDELGRERAGYEEGLARLQEQLRWESRLEQQLALQEKDVQRARQEWAALDQKQRELLSLRRSVELHRVVAGEKEPGLQVAREALVREEAAWGEAKETHLGRLGEQDKAEQRLERGRLLERARQSLEEQRRLEVQLRQGERLEKLLEGSRKRADVSKALSDAEVRRVEEAERKQRQAQDRLDVRGIQVGFTPEAPQTIEWEAQGSVQRHKLAKDEQKLFAGVTSGSLRIKGVGEVRLSTGAEEVGKLQAEVEKYRKEVARKLQEHGVKSLQELRERWDAQRAVLQAHEKHEEALTTFLEAADVESVEALREQLREQAGRVGALAGQLNLSVEVLDAQPSPDLEELADELKVRRQEVRAREKVKDEAEVRYRQAERHARMVSQEREGALESARALELELTTRLEAEGLTLEQLGAKVVESGDALARLENMLKGLREQLPRPEERASSRCRQLEEARERVLEAERQAQARIIRAEALLEQGGESGAYSRLGEAEEKLALAVEAHQRLRTRAEAADLLRQRVRHWQEQVNRTFVAPMEAAVQARLSHIRGEGRRESLVLGADLDDAGLRTQDGARALAQFSWGMQEQTLFALRLALGELLSRQGHAPEPQLVVLDDALVNTDSVRHARALDLIATAGESLQVLILTAFPERYRTLRGLKEFDLRALAHDSASAPGRVA
ncbi:hypothetical protein LY474_32885 [Myxococcus stipitatus]|uniref:hypothetical protein n=1 Tax=Myxococcus stipitatus TaxID=83455 RepID=UPI001F4896AE|nr:hypothetical protein [Myxococcus stipitatus]MCE9672614.1 hypothetical protein [Myxococcus stipitatus]